MSSTTLRNLAFRWSNGLLYSPWLVLLITLVLAYGAFRYTATHLSINTDTAELIAPDAPFQQNRRRFEQQFNQDAYTLLLVLESSSPELTKAAAARMARELRADTDHIAYVYRPDDHLFFRQNGLLFLDTDKLQDFSVTLAQAQPFIGRISQDPSLNGFFSIFEDALNAENPSDEVPIDLISLMGKVSVSLHRTLNGETDLLSWQTLIAENEISKAQSDKALIFVKPKPDYRAILPVASTIDVIREAAQRIQDPNLPTVRVRITGEVGLEHDEMVGMSEGTFTASLFSIVLVCGILFLAYRSWLLVSCTLATLGLGLIFCGLFAAVSVKQLNLISVAFAVSNIGLGVEYAIHFCLRYRDSLAMHGRDKVHAIRTAILDTSPSLILCAGTTAIGLYAFIPTDYQGISELGLLAGTSLFICLFITLTVLPVLLKIMPTPSVRAASKDETPGASPLSRSMAWFTLHYARPITLITLVAAIGGIFLVTQIETDFSPLNLRDPDTESVKAFKDLMRHKDTSPMTLTYLADSAAEVQSVSARLKQLPTVDKTISLLDFVPDEQDDKLAIIDEMVMTLGPQGQFFPQLKTGSDPKPAIERMVKAIDANLPKRSHPADIAALQNFRHELQDVLLELDARFQPNRGVFIEKIQTSLLGTLPTVMNELLTGFKAETIYADDIPADLRERWLSRDDLYRLQIFPKHDLNDLNNMQRFITDVQTIVPDVTDLPIMYWESMKAVISAFQQAIIIALLAIAGLLLFIRRSVVDTLLVMAPLVLAGLFTMASTVLTGTPINFANIIALPLLMGLGVDNGIHMVEKLHHSLSEQQNIYQSSTARGMFFGALTTVSSFAGLAFSPHQGIASMGLVITIGIFWIMTCTFIVLPAIAKLVLKPVSANSVG
ncbi:MAG: hopanoid biosynthesis-associated RND transporter HpnN [Methylomonas sp.]|nr:MAG: hopanoid biosynthesis-associated RND transporter HpnN [Methylomonas sp.]PPD26989.1 MAG: hopanoid biosynthesis-associated RND transporter HpnN [Methylomonas sp.]PPD38928.1 MAG: hopanoid biosynthesis-associated RND transporter HpnN [Methylomonas sp.]PPD42588.1 MAG: hopanoid biosynthesis-associated RND transporter HpnN [Methylomonas sp.]PPD54140.1 MAG: hopanoid biosynthesis-associated RND transporter HpnN [Methylomonas sp.]